MVHGKHQGLAWLKMIPAMRIRACWLSIKNEPCFLVELVDLTANNPSKRCDWHYSCESMTWYSNFQILAIQLSLCNHADTPPHIEVVTSTLLQLYSFDKHNKVWRQWLKQWQRNGPKMFYWYFGGPAYSWIRMPNLFKAPARNFKLWMLDITFSLGFT